MSYADLLINTCTILEDTGVGPDAYGNITPNWTVVAGLSNIDCRLMASTGREIMTGVEVVIADYKLFLNDIIITERNRVRISGIDYEVLLVADRQDSATTHHKECYMRTVR